MDVTRIDPRTRPLDLPGGAIGTPAEGPASFGAVLEDSIAQVNRLQHEADRAIGALATGGGATLHDTMISIEKADLSFKLMMQVRNKIVEAYQEILRMQV
jgi:flagellar hook-basal body complex protein FliE